MSGFVLSDMFGDTAPRPLRHTLGHAIGHETTRCLSLTLREFPKESPRRPPVPTQLDEEVDQVSVLIQEGGFWENGSEVGP